jgi:hypothetical protein
MGDIATLQATHANLDEMLKTASGDRAVALFRAMVAIEEKAARLRG